MKIVFDIIKETELYKELQRRKLKESLPGIKRTDFLSIGFEGLPIRTHQKRQKDVNQRRSEATSETP